MLRGEVEMKLSNFKFSEHGNSKEFITINDIVFRKDCTFEFDEAILTISICGYVMLASMFYSDIKTIEGE